MQILSVLKKIYMNKILSADFTSKKKKKKGADFDWNLKWIRSQSDQKNKSAKSYCKKKGKKKFW